MFLYVVYIIPKSQKRKMGGIDLKKRYVVIIAVVFLLIGMVSGIGIQYGLKNTLSEDDLESFYSFYKTI